jgi:hypothetical protein
LICTRQGSNLQPYDPKLYVSKGDCSHRIVRRALPAGVGECEYQNEALIGWFVAVNQTRGGNMRTLRFSVDASFCAVEENGELSMASQEDIETLPQGPDLTQAEIESLDERT